MLPEIDPDQPVMAGDITAYMTMVLIEIVAELAPAAEVEEILERIASRMLESSLKIPPSVVHSLVAGTAHDLMQTEGPAMQG